MAPEVTCTSKISAALRPIPSSTPPAQEIRDVRPLRLLACLHGSRWSSRRLPHELSAACSTSLADDAVDEAAMLFADPREEEMWGMG